MSNCAMATASGGAREGSRGRALAGGRPISLEAPYEELPGDVYSKATKAS